MKIKNKLLKLISIVILLLTTIFIFPSFAFSVKDTDIGRKAIEAFGKKIKKKKGWNLSGSGGSFYNPEKIVLSVHFQAYGRYSLEESRKLIIEVADDFIDFINQSKNCSKIFKIQKISEKNIKLSISFYPEPNQTIIEGHYIDYVFLQNGTLTYCYESEDGYRLDSNDEEDETYEQAHTIVMQEKSRTQEIQNSLDDRKENK